jgi:hypothetical protein
MTLTLTSDDQSRLAETTHLLISPLDYPHVDQWHSAVNRSLKELLGADMAAFMLGSTMYSEDLPPDAVRQYPYRMPEIPGFQGLWQRQVGLAAWNRPLMYGKLLGAYYHTEYYNDYILPARAYDSLGLTIAPTGEIRPGSLAGLLVHHDRPNARRFGERGLSLMRLLVRPFARVWVSTCALRRIERGSHGCWTTGERPSCSATVPDRSSTGRPRSTGC